MLEPADRSAALAQLCCDQRTIDMTARAELLGTGARLRSTLPFRSLSTAEAALL